MALDASLPALVQLAGLLAVHWRRVLVHALAAPLCKGCEQQDTGSRVTTTHLGSEFSGWCVFLPMELQRSTWLTGVSGAGNRESRLQLRSLTNSPLLGGQRK